jgi:arginyl-tRNA--protein-N-Asp/Glu arginylyltransferase
MNTQAQTSPQFFMTAPAPCPYLPGQVERKVFTHLVGQRAPEMNDILTQGGFRRSQNIAYRPACEGCRACVSVRILVDDFKPTKSMKRVAAANLDLVAKEYPAEPSTEQFSLFRHYLDSRHQSGGMSDMTVLDYAMMVEDSHVTTRLVEYRLQGGDVPVNRRGEGPLIGVSLTDVLGDGLSMVYSFYEPEMKERSVGTFMILEHIRRAKAMGLAYVYLGYWVEGSKKMAYKARFLPQERLGPKGWDRVES